MCSSQVRGGRQLGGKGGVVVVVVAVVVGGAAECRLLDVTETGVASADFTDPPIRSLFLSFLFCVFFASTE